MKMRSASGTVPFIDRSSVHISSSVSSTSSNCAGSSGKVSRLKSSGFIVRGGVFWLFTTGSGMGSSAAG